MTYYCRSTPYLLSSPNADRSSNLLVTPDAEDFTSARKPFFDEVTAVAGDDGNGSTSIYLDGWVGVALAAPNDAITNFVPLMVRVKNTGTQYGWVYWMPVDDLSATSVGAQYTAVLPGRTVTVYARWVEDIYDDPTGFPGAICVNCPNGSDGTTMEVTVVQLDIDTVMEDLGISEA